MNDTHPPRRAFAALVSLPDDAIDLGQASLLIARQEYPDLEVGPYLARLDDMARAVSLHLKGGERAVSRIAHLNHLLFEELGFRGNREEYDDPRNSFLNDVLDRRVGIPITLSAIYLEVGRRLGIPLAGVGFPGHFLVRYLGRDVTTEIFIDPFNRGLILTEAECRQRLEERYRGRLSFRPEFLKRARTREILERMLNNLKGIFQARRDYHRALGVQELLLCIHPERPTEIRDRGLIYQRLALLGQAAEDLRLYLEADPEAPDAAPLRRRLSELSRLAPRWN
ncbi:MAG TPA: tetratricopeptide repeat protein [Candidatus Polarisedimenticolia bacterium]|nr:tetratricopeptide repeat protein [Candidatus Polarisedimenticolia bacterium]